MDINKVYKALQWLKDHNLHYSEIRLPASFDDLITELQETKYRIVSDGSGSDKIDEVVEDVQHNKDNNDQAVLKRKAFLMQITKNSDINNQYIPNAGEKNR